MPFMLVVVEIVHLVVVMVALSAASLLKKDITNICLFVMQIPSS